MNNKFLLFCFLLLPLVGCETEKPLSISPENFSEKELSDCKSVSCPKISINYFTVTGEETVIKVINRKITKFIISSLQIGEEPVKANTIAEAAKSFIETYRMHSAEFPDMAAEYFAEIDVHKIFKNKSLLSVELKQYKFTGGAHGYGSRSFANFDPKTGELLQQKDLFNDVTAFKHFAEEEFRKQHNISEGEPINSTGFWFENETFYLPETIGFTSHNIIIHYNQYDIASYAEGPIELKIPLDDAEKFLAISVK